MAEAGAQATARPTDRGRTRGRGSAKGRGEGATQRQEARAGAAARAEARSRYLVEFPATGSMSWWSSWGAWGWGGWEQPWAEAERGYSGPGGEPSGARGGCTAGAAGPGGEPSGATRAAGRSRSTPRLPATGGRTAPWNVQPKEARKLVKGFISKRWTNLFTGEHTEKCKSWRENCNGLQSWDAADMYWRAWLAARGYSDLATASEKDVWHDPETGARFGIDQAKLQAQCEPFQRAQPYPTWKYYHLGYSRPYWMASPAAGARGEPSAPEEGYHLAFHGAHGYAVSAILALGGLLPSETAGDPRKPTKSASGYSTAGGQPHLPSKGVFLFQCCSTSLMQAMCFPISVLNLVIRSLSIMQAAASTPQRLPKLLRNSRSPRFSATGRAWARTRVTCAPRRSSSWWPFRVGRPTAPRVAWHIGERCRGGRRSKSSMRTRATNMHTIY